MVGYKLVGRYGVEVDGLNRVLQGVGREGLKGCQQARSKMV